jgi:hypothetical protein
MTPAAKRALEQAARPMRKGRRVSPLDVLVCLLDLKHPDPLASLIVELDLDAEAVRARIMGT